MFASESVTVLFSWKSVVGLNIHIKDLKDIFEGIHFSGKVYA